MIFTYFAAVLGVVGVLLAIKIYLDSDPAEYYHRYFYLFVRLITFGGMWLVGMSIILKVNSTIAVLTTAVGWLLTIFIPSGIEAFNTNPKLKIVRVISLLLLVMMSVFYVVGKILI